MASQEEIQSYLQRHKIGLLFEDLMSKLINDQPDEPLAYLSGVLHFRAEKKGQKSHLRKSMGDFDTAAVAKDRVYEKPWQTNTRRSRPKELDTKGVRRSMPAKADWDATNKSPTTFDDFWDQGNKGAAKKRSASPSKKTNAWANLDAQDEDLLYLSHGYRGPQRQELSDPLAGEFSLAKANVEKPRAQSPAKTNSRAKGRKHDALKHKCEQQKLIIANQRARDSGFEEEKDLDEDNAIELMEDLEELKREGAGNLKNKSGIRISNTQRASSRITEPQVKVGICARCATVMSGCMPSEKSEKYGQLPDVDDEASPRFPSAPYSSGPFANDDDEFESVSQVTGPRKPVWQETDQDALTPRKGAHMFTSNMAPTKGYPMYSSDRPMTSGGRSMSPNRGPAEPLRQTWAADTSSDTNVPLPKDPTSPKKPVEGQVEKPDTSRTKDDEFDATRGGWAVHGDETDMSSVYGAPINGQKNRGSYQGAF